MQLGDLYISYYKRSTEDNAPWMGHPRCTAWTGMDSVEPPTNIYINYVMFLR